MSSEFGTYIQEEWAQLKTLLHTNAQHRVENNIQGLRQMEPANSLATCIETGVAILRTDISIEFLQYTALIAGMRLNDDYDELQQQLNDAIPKASF